MLQKDPMQEKIIAKAMKDEAFRRELLRNPKAVLERELGITIPQGVTVQVHEDTPATVHLVLPMNVQRAGLMELSDAELEQATGGLRPDTSSSQCGIDPCGWSSPSTD